MAAVALVLAHAPLSQFTFVLIFTCNIVVAIVQEIRAKVKIDKLSILSAPTAKVLRNGKKKEIPVEEIVLDDVIFLSSGQQIPADCVMLDGAGDVNEALLHGRIGSHQKSRRRSASCRLVRNGRQSYGARG